MKNNFTVPFFGIKRQYANLREELLETIDTVYSSGQVLDGSYTRYFERAVALRCERKYAVARRATMTMPAKSVFNFSALVHNKSAARPEPVLLI